MNYLYRTFLFGLLILGWAANAHAEIITIDGTVKSIDAQKRTITVESGAKERTLDISSKAKVSIDGEDSDLDGLKEGQTVSLSYHDQLEVVVKIEALDQPAMAPPKDSSTFEGHAYKFFLEVLTWHRAKKRCEDMGGHLAIISSANEDTFVMNLAKRNIKKPEQMDGYWLGATDEEKEGEWKWIDGSEIRFSNWGEGQPNNKREVEHYMLYFVRGNKWCDQPDKSDQHRAFFVCEWDLSDEPTDDEGKTISLFDGKTLNGWNGDTKYWKVEDGTIVGTSPNKLQGGTFLASTETFDNFVLKAKFKLTEGNSGIQFRSQRLAKHRMSGYQADIAYGDFKFLGWLAAEGMAQGVIAQTTPHQQTQVAQVVDKDGWNEYVITAAGDRMTLEINGVKTVDVHDDGALSGAIGFQLHGGNPTKVAFKDITIEKLP